MIEPTVGRVVWYHPYQNEALGFVYPMGQPCAAIVTHVWSDTCVNLVVFDANGYPHSRTSVLLHQGDSDRPSYGFCEWMPYQKGQATKTEALEAKLGGEPRQWPDQEPGDIAIKGM